jgi:excisionase family DNA binding protein
MPETYLLPDEAATYLRVAVKTLTQWRWRGKGPPYRKVAGNLIRYAREDLDTWMAEQSVAPMPEPPESPTLPPPPTPRAALHALPPRRRVRGSRAQT